VNSLRAGEGEVRVRRHGKLTLRRTKAMMPSPIEKSFIVMSGDDRLLCQLTEEKGSCCRVAIQIRDVDEVCRICGVEVWCRFANTAGSKSTYGLLARWFPCPKAEYAPDVIGQNRTRCLRLLLQTGS